VPEGDEVSTVWAWRDRPGDAIVACCGEKLLRYAEFQARVGAWRDTLAAQAGRRWAVYFRDGYEFTCALLGGWLAGKTVVLPTEIQPGTLERLRGYVAGFLGEFPLDAVLGAPDPTAPLSRMAGPDPAAPVLEVFTSGSTGDPVAIPKSLRQLDREVETLHGLWGEQVGTARVLASVSHQHFYGLIFKILWPLWRGAPFLSESVWYPEEVATQLHGTPGVWVTSPALLKRLPADLPWAAIGPNVRFVLSAGSPLPTEAARQCARLLGCAVTEVYGSSETGVVGWRKRGEIETPWRPFPGVSIRCATDSGVLIVRSPWVPEGEEWLTADQGEVHSDGTFTLSGRADRIVKIEEKRVSLTALERALQGSGLVAEARTLLLSEGRVGAVVVPGAEGNRLLRHAGRRALVERLREAVRPHAEVVGIPRRFRFVTALPQDTMGKVADSALLHLFRLPDSHADSPLVLEEICGDAEATFRLSIPATLASFEGHFPGTPILPGVVQVDWAVGFARRCFRLPHRFLGLEVLKFQRVIVPESVLTLTLSRAVDGL
jgi:acyl-coenzyme A synthetase/AMP-(fatty) acid ligase